MNLFTCQDLQCFSILDTFGNIMNLFTCQDLQCFSILDTFGNIMNESLFENTVRIRWIYKTYIKVEVAVC